MTDSMEYDRNSGAILENAKSIVQGKITYAGALMQSGSAMKDRVITEDFFSISFLACKYCQATLAPNGGRLQ